MDKEKLDHLKELAEKATQEPWDSLMCFGDEFENYIGPDSWVDDGKWIAAFRYAQDAKYIAAAQPATILALIAEIERLEEEADTLACFCTDLCPNVPFHINCQSCDDCPGMDCKESEKPEAWRKRAAEMMKGE